MNTSICVAESLCYEPETITALVISYAAATDAKSFQSCLTLCDPIDGIHQASPSLRFSRQEHWSGLPFPSPMHESENEVTRKEKMLETENDSSCCQGTEVKGGNVYQEA